MSTARFAARTFATVASTLVALAATASPVSGTYTVTGSNFFGSTASPFASITESFAISFDNATSVSQRTTGIVLGSSTITPASTLAYTYIAGADTLIVGGLASTVATSDPNSTDFSLIINNASNTANFGIASLSYSVGDGSVYTALTTRRDALSVPEPSTLALLALALPAIGAARRRSRPAPAATLRLA